MKLQQKIFGIGLLTAAIVPHLYEKGYISYPTRAIPLFMYLNIVLFFLADLLTYDLEGWELSRK